MTSRRDFLKQASALGAGAMASGGSLPLESLAAPPSLPADPAIPVVIASANGLQAVARAMEIIRSGGDALDGVIAGVNIVEDDPNDHSVGYGGLPNEEGVVELDAAVMHGPTHRAGAVASIRNIRNPSKVARVVMERTDHVLLVGEGALRFARAHGFKEENLLTDEAREIWLKWKETMSTQDDWITPEEGKEMGLGVTDDGAPADPHDRRPFRRLTGTIHCSGIDLKGNISCVTTTSGLAYKIPGRVGDSPIIGAGLYLDNAVGAAGSTGRGEANLVNCSSVIVVEAMRQGRSPEQACLEACKRIAEHTLAKHLRDEKGRPNFNVNFYAVNRKGEFGGAGIWSGGKMAVADAGGARLVGIAHLYERK